MKISILVAFLFSFVLRAQEVYFEYDESGNQVFRGIKEVNKNQSSKVPNREEKSEDNEWFFKEVRIFPNPVKDILSVDWTEKIGEQIYQIQLYQHSNLHWVYRSDATDLAQRKAKIPMQSYPYGIYILTFVLKDGKRMSVNISKLP